MTDTINLATGEIIPAELATLAKAVIATRDELAQIKADLAAFSEPLEAAKRRAERAATEASERFIAAAAAANVQSVPVGIHTVTAAKTAPSVAIAADVKPEDHPAYAWVRHEWDKAAIASAIKGGELLNFATLQPGTAVRITNRGE